MARKFALFAVLYFLFLSAMPAFAPPWTPNFDTVEGRVDFLLALLARHPGFVATNALSFKRNLPDMVKTIPQVTSALGASANPLTAGASDRLSVLYSNEGNFDPARMQALRTKWADDMEKLGLKDLKGIQSDLAELKATARKGDKFDQAVYQENVSRYLRLLPFLYKEDGAAREGGKDAILARMKAMGPTDLEALVSSASAFKPQLGSNGAALQIYDGVVKNFWAKEAIKAATPVDRAGKTVQGRTIGIQSVPASMGIFRACFAGDCSLMSIPYYPLLKDAKTYVITGNEGPNGPPKGYALVIPAKVNGETVPYVLTMNGETLTASDVRSVMQLVTHDWGAKGIVVPKIESNPYIVNTPRIRDGLQAPGRSAVRVELPEAALAKIRPHDRPFLFTGKSFYDPEAIRDAEFVTADPASAGFITKIGKTAGNINYEPPAEVEHVPTLDRAVIAAQVMKDVKGADRARMLARLKISEAQLSAVNPLLEASETKPLTSAQFTAASKALGLTLDHVMDLDLFTRALSLGNIHRDLPGAADEATWRRLAKKANALIEVELPHAEHMPAIVERGYLAKIALPGDYAEIAKEIAEILKSPGSPRHAGVLAAIAKKWPPALDAFVEDILRNAPKAVRAEFHRIAAQHSGGGAKTGWYAGLCKRIGNI